jgi:hypothetical protein
MAARRRWIALAAMPLFAPDSLSFLLNLASDM